jgi:hypothetical protein
MPISTLNSFDIAKYYRDHKYFIIEVIEAAKSESWDYQIAKPCCCTLGKDLKTHEGKPFTEHPSWHKAHALHHELHRVMEAYFATAKSKAPANALKDIQKQADDVSYQLMREFEAVIEAFGAEKAYLKQIETYRKRAQTCKSACKNDHLIG